jgi:hypothetical protein
MRKRDLVEAGRAPTARGRTLAIDSRRMCCRAGLSMWRHVAMEPVPAGDIAGTRPTSRRDFVRRVRVSGPKLRDPVRTVVHNVRHRGWAENVAAVSQLEAATLSLPRYAVIQFSDGFEWSRPSLSVALSALNLGSVSTIVAAPVATKWQPFDPRDITKRPDLRDYGIPVVIQQ